ncbi:MAG: hypothetical protein GY835_03185 [bacterium]|nr:hypothetical protein [bacterium]
MSKSLDSSSSTRPPFPWYGWIGISVLIFGGLGIVADIVIVKRLLTPILWSGYIPFADGILKRLHGWSYLGRLRHNLPVILIISVVYWMVFEGYNQHMQGWRYLGLPSGGPIRTAAFVWSFATIVPALLITNEIFLGFAADATERRLLPGRHPAVFLLFFLGLALLVTPLITPQRIAVYLFAFVFTGFILVFDPLNWVHGKRSLLAELRAGNFSLALALTATGFWCGLLWEAWNHWATTKWIYVFPSHGCPNLFEMPLVGYLGYPFFAAEVFALWEFLTSAKRAVHHPPF